MDKFYRYINFYPLPLWLAMMFLPRHPLTERAARSSTLFGIAALNYVIALLVGLRPGAGKDAEFPDFTSLDGLSKALGDRPGALAAWSHMLALDLFTGAWIYRESVRLNAPALIRIPALVFTLLTGPFGLLLFLLWRLLAGKPEAIGQQPTV